MKHRDVHTGADLRDWISSRGLTQAQFAELASLSLSQARRWMDKPKLRPWVSCLLEGVERRLEMRKLSRRRRDRNRVAKQFHARLPVRDAHAALPTPIKELIGDLEK